MYTIKQQLLVAIKEYNAAEDATKTASARLHDTKRKLDELSTQFATDVLGDKRDEPLVIHLGDELGLWCNWHSSHREPSTQVIKVQYGLD